jgi:hypothetical protein
MTPHAPTSTEIYLRAAAVQLIDRHGKVPSGAIGHIVGRFARENPTYIVSFAADVIEVRGDEIVTAAA